MKIFLLEDDASIAMGLEYSLQKEGYETALAKTVEQAFAMISKEEFSLYLLDLTLPDGSGYDVCRKIKEKGDYPIIFLTAFDDEVNVVMGFDLGADDYISKPFRVNELMARIKSVLRRYNSENGKSGIIELHGLKINTNEAKVYKNGAEIILTAMEYRLLLILVNNRGRVLTRTQLLENIWDIDGIFVNDNTLTVYIKRLRDKIEDNSDEPGIIKTVRKMGYIME
ncbi:MAG: response regulator transcription factor [Eubacterium sp.]